MSGLGSVWKNSAFNVVYKLANLLFPLISAGYVSRILLPTGIGRVSAAQNIVSYFLTFAALGLPSYGVREIAKVRFNREEVDKTFTELLVINSISTAISVVSYFVLISLVNDYRLNFSLYFACGLQLFFNFINIDWLYQGEEDYAYISIRSIVIKFISLILLLLVVKTSQDYLIYAYITSFALGMNYFFNIVHARKYVKITKNGLHLKKHLTPLMILLITIFLSNLYNKVDITMLGIFSTEEATGLYTNAHKIIEILVTACAAITAVFLPRLSYYYEHDKESFYNLLAKGVRILSFLTFPLMAGLFLLAPQGMTILFGNAFCSGATTLRIFSVLIVIKCFGDLLCYQLTICSGNEKKRLPAYFFAAVANIILNFFLIPIMAQNGAALASIISEVIVNGIQIISMRKIIGFKLECKPFIQAVLSTAVMIVSIVFILCVFKNSIVQAIVSFFVGCAMYLLINLFLKNDIMLAALGYIKCKIHK